VELGYSPQDCVRLPQIQLLWIPSKHYLSLKTGLLASSFLIVERELRKHERERSNRKVTIHEREIEVDELNGDTNGCLAERATSPVARAHGFPSVQLGTFRVRFGWNGSKWTWFLTS
jgi:hypothetical protein